MHLSRRPNQTVYRVRDLTKFHFSILGMHELCNQSFKDTIIFEMSEKNNNKMNVHRMVCKHKRQILISIGTSNTTFLVNRMGTFFCNVTLVNS